MNGQTWSSLLGCYGTLKLVPGSFDTPRCEL